jgi:hypothetical protein
VSRIQKIWDETKSNQHGREELRRKKGEKKTGFEYISPDPESNEGLLLASDAMICCK